MRLAKSMDAAIARLTLPHVTHALMVGLLRTVVVLAAVQIYVSAVTRTQIRAVNASQVISWRQINQHALRARPAVPSAARLTLVYNVTPSSTSECSRRGANASAIQPRAGSKTKTQRTIAYVRASG